MTVTEQQVEKKTEFGEFDKSLGILKNRAQAWAQTSIEERLIILDKIRDGVSQVAENWAKTASRQKQIPEGSPLEGEEWISGPYAVLAGCNQLMHTLSMMADKKFVDKLPVRTTVTGQISAKIMPHSIWDHLLLSGVRADVWMTKDVDLQNLKSHTAGAYDVPEKERKGRVSLVLGAGNIAAIAPLDCFQKLFSEHQVVILKMNPVNDYLADFLATALKPLIEFGALRIVKGGAEVGAYLCEHEDVDEIHITGAEASHDAIVWGVGAQKAKNKTNGTPINTRRVSSELGAVCPTIVVPGPWTKADLAFQAAQVATQKLHNSGFNCVACQVLILPDNWNKTEPFLQKLEETMAKTPPRQLYYPGANQRLDDFSSHGENVVNFARPGADACLVAPMAKDGADAWFQENEVFAPAMSLYRIAENDPEAYLRAAIDYANKNLHGTLGANILIHPATIRKIGRKKFEFLIADLHYGTIAINAWTGLGFLMPQCPWGAFPGHTLDDVQSGIGFVHNTYMFDKVERCVVSAPFRPFPRNLLSLSATLLPKPPWFVNNRKQHKVGRLLTRFQYRPSFLKLPRIFLNALLG